MALIRICNDIPVQLIMMTSLSLSISASFTGRDEVAISSAFSRIPEQKILNSGLISIDSTTRVLKENIQLKSSAINDIKGKTIEDPTILTYFLASGFDSPFNLLLVTSIVHL